MTNVFQKNYSDWNKDNQYTRVLCRVLSASPHDAIEDRWKTMDLRIEVDHGITSIGRYELTVDDIYDWNVTDGYRERRSYQSAFGSVLLQSVESILGPWESMVGAYFVGLWPEDAGQMHGMDCLGIQSLEDESKILIFEDLWNKYGKDEYDKVNTIIQNQRDAEYLYQGLMRDSEKAALETVKSKFKELF